MNWYEMNINNVTPEVMKNLSSSETPMLYDLYNLNLVKSNLLQEQSWKITFIALYSIVITLGVVENISILVVIGISKQLHTVTNLFISVLALSDITLCLFNLPFQLHYGLTDNWVFGTELCYIILPLFGVPVFVSTLSMVMIAVERYILIVCPFRTKLGYKKALFIIIVIVLFSFLASVPVLLNMDMRTVIVDFRPIVNKRHHISYCMESWEGDSGRIYTVFVFVTQFFIPKSLLIILYFNIYKTLKKRPIRRRENSQNYRTTGILVAMTLFFTIAWLPFQIFSLINYFHSDLLELLDSAYELTDLLLKIIAMSSACVNPFLYGWLNKNLRHEVKNMLDQKFRLLKRGSAGEISTARNVVLSLQKRSTVME